jgi:ankyrin repeat protein
VYRGGHVGLIDLLLGAGENVSSRDVRGATPLTLSIYQEHAAAAQVMAVTTFGARSHTYGHFQATDQ